MPFVYMASALLLKNKIPAQSHNGVVGQIGLYFVTTGRLSKENGRLYSRSTSGSFSYKDERRDVSFDRLPICRGDGDATVELALQEQNPVHLFYFFGSVDNTRFSGSGYFQLT